MQSESFVTDEEFISREYSVVGEIEDDQGSYEEYTSKTHEDSNSKCIVESYYKAKRRWLISKYILGNSVLNCSFQTLHCRCTEPHWQACANLDDGKNQQIKYKSKAQITVELVKS